MDSLIDYFVGGEVEFFQLPLEPVKAGYTPEIDRRREELNTSPADSEEASRLEADLESLEEKRQVAPDKPVFTPATTDFGGDQNLQNADTLADTGNGIEIGCRIGDHWARISAARNGADALSTPMAERSNMFCFEAIAMEGCETDLRERLMELESIRTDSESDWTEEFEAEELQIGEALQLIDESTVDLSAAQTQAARLLLDLGIQNVQITACEQAAFSPLSLENLEGVETSFDTRSGTYLEFSRECGGIPCVSRQGQLWWNEEAAPNVHSTFLVPEWGTIVLDADGTPVAFTWQALQKTEQIQSETNDVLPFEELTDEYVEWAAQAHGVVNATLHIEDVQLVMGFIEAADDPAGAVAVPAWYVRGIVEQLDENGDRLFFNSNDCVLLNALDGIPILTPLF